ncbi:transmembrane and immunoglobulin domain-containing protein 2 [Talpa occidentalis]|uniref:transmembrane and immunoglobulin domain-containing protein 2 n=1 Tax=Talpa occidentalis TaxID=50954 RepID=UPI0023F99045|nr:transmembrane and immunoglobulin domain-containing protein 2 [Talpa occidentalis]
MHPALLAGCVLVVLTAIALGAGIWIRRRGHREAENPLYSNIPRQPRRARRTEVGAAEGRKQLDIPREDQKAESFYSTSFPRPPSPPQNRTPAPSPCPSPRPRPRPPISAGRISPHPGPYG